jgi:hypothetical protein
VSASDFLGVDLNMVTFDDDPRESVKDPRPPQTDLGPLRRTAEVTAGSNPAEEAHLDGVARRTKMPVDVVRQDPAKFDRQELATRVANEAKSRTVRRMYEDPATAKLLDGADLDDLKAHENAFLSWSKYTVGNQFVGGAHDLGIGHMGAQEVYSVKTGQGYLTGLRGTVLDTLMNTRQDYARRYDILSSDIYKAAPGEFVRAMPMILSSLGLGVVGSAAATPAGGLALAYMGAASVQTGLIWADMERAKDIDDKQFAADAAFVGGAITGGFEILGAHLATRGLAFTVRKTVASAVRSTGAKQIAFRRSLDVIGGMLEEGGTEGAQAIVEEMSARIGRERKKGKPYLTIMEEMWVDDQFWRNVAQSVVGGGLVGAGMSTGATIYEARNDSARIVNAKAERESFENVDGVLAASTLKGKSPAQYRNVLHQLSDEAEVTDVYVDAEVLTEFVEDPENREMVEDLNDKIEGFADTVEDAKSGVDAVLPVTEWAKVAGTNFTEAISDGVTFSPEGVSERELARLAADGRTVEQMAKDLLDEVEDDEVLNAVYEEARDTLAARLTSELGMSETDAEASAVPLASSLIAVARELGRDPTEYFTQQMNRLKLERTDVVPQSRNLIEMVKDDDGNDVMLQFDEYTGKLIMTPEVEQYFKNSAVRDEDGVLTVHFHGSRGDVAKISSLQPLTHFGSPAAARMRLEEYGVSEFHDPSEAEGGPGAGTYPTYLNITNPITLRDVGLDHGYAILNAIGTSQDINGLTDDQIDMIEPELAEAWAARKKSIDDLGDLRLLRDTGMLTQQQYAEKVLELQRERDERGLAVLRRAMRKIGHDGIKYENEVEDPGHDSYIILYPAQAKSIFNLRPTGHPDVHRQDVDREADLAASRTDRDYEQLLDDHNYIDDLDGLIPKFTGGKKKGQYKGASERASTRAGLRKMVKKIEGLVDEGVSGRYWYEDTARMVLKIARGNFREAERIIELLAIYSPQAAVQVNTHLAVRAYTQWSRGEPIRVSSGNKDAKAHAVLYEDTPWEGVKTDAFYRNLLHGLLQIGTESEIASLKIPDESHKGRKVTSDVWVFRAFEYASDAASNDLGGGKYSFTETVVRHITAKLNSARSEGDPVWYPHQVQAALWSAIQTRSNVPEVKSKTMAKSRKEGLLAPGFTKVRNRKTGEEERVPAYEVRVDKSGRKYRVRKMVPPASGKKRAQHLKNWNRYAMQVPSDTIRKLTEDLGFSFADVLHWMTMHVPWEAVPAPALESPLLTASYELRSAFTDAAKRIVIDDDGTDLIADAIGVPIYYPTPGVGGWDSAVSPNITSRVLPNKPAGDFSYEEADLYAAIVKYVFKQAAVPWFRPWPRAKPRELQYVVHYRNMRKGKHVAVKGGALFENIDEATAFAKAHNEKHAQNPDMLVRVVSQRVHQGKVPFSRGWKIGTRKALTPSQHEQFLEDLEEAFGGIKPGFSSLPTEREFVVMNYRDDDTGLPFDSDEDFDAGIDAFMERFGEKYGIEAERTGKLVAEFRYGGEHDWGEHGDAIGESLLKHGPLAERPDLHERVRDWRGAFEEVLEEYEAAAEDARSVQVEEALHEPLDDDGRDPRVLEQPAYHGTAVRNIKKFKMQYIGTGEGAQAVAWGMYFSSQRAIGEAYRKKLSRNVEDVTLIDGVPAHSIHDVMNTKTSVAPISSIEGSARSDVMLYLPDVAIHGLDAVLQHIDEDVKVNLGAADTSSASREVRIQYRVKEILEGLRGKTITRRPSETGQLYQVEVPEDSDLIDWMKPVPGQPPKVRALFEDLASETKLNDLHKQLKAELEANGQTDKYDALASEWRVRREVVQAYSDMQRAQQGEPRGSYLYEKISRALKSPQAASEFLNSHGIRGVRYPVGLFSGGSVADGHKTNYVIWDEESIQIEGTFYQPKQSAGPRGFTDLTDLNKIVIALTSGANKSTFLHESAHFLMQIFEEAASDPNASEGLKADYERTQEWLGADVGGGFTHDMKERFASAYEVYLMEGRAPSPHLQSAFDRFTVWLTRIYTTIIERFRDARVDDEIRGIFDRLMVGQKEVDKSRESASVGRPLLTRGVWKRIGEDPNEYEDYVRSVQRADAEDRFKQQRAVMQRLLRENASERKKVRERITAEENERLRNDPLQRLRARVVDDEEISDESMPADDLRGRLNVGALQEAIGGKRAKKLVESLPRSMVLRKAGVTDVHVIAALYGFPDVHAMVVALAGSTPFGRAVRESVDARVRSEHPELDASRAELAQHAARIVAVGEASGAVMRREIGALLEAAERDSQAAQRAAQHRDSQDRQEADEDGARAGARGFARTQGAMSVEGAQRALQSAREDLKNVGEDPQERAAAGKSVAVAEAHLGEARAAARERRSRGASARRLRPPSRPVLLQAARQIVDKQKAGNLKRTSAVYRRAANDSYRKSVVAVAEGRWADAARERTQHAVYLEASAMMAEDHHRINTRINAVVKKLKSKSGSKRRRRYAPQHYAHSLALAVRHGVIRHNGQIETEDDLRTFVQEQLGDNLSQWPGDDALFSEDKRSWKSAMTVSEIMNVLDAISTLDRWALDLARDVESAKAAKHEESVEALVSQAAVFARGVNKNNPEDSLDWQDRARSKMSKFWGGNVRWLPFLDSMDEEKFDGPFKKFLFRPIKAAVEARGRAIQKANEDLSNIFMSVYGSASVVRDLRKKNIDAYPQLGIPSDGPSYFISRASLIGMFMNWGNEGGRAAILRSRQRPYTEDQIFALFAAHLNPEDIQLANKLHAYLDSYYADIAALEKRMNGVAPGKVEPARFMLDDGSEMPGGYFPLQPDVNFANAEVALQIEKDLEAGVFSNHFGSPQTQKGHTFERRGFGGQRPVFDIFQVIPRHLDNVITDIQLREAVASTWKLHRDGRVLRAMNSAIGPQYTREYSDWVRRQVQGLVRVADGDQWLRAVRQMGAITVLGFKIRTVMIQAPALLEGVAEIGPRYTAEGLLRLFVPGGPGGWVPIWSVVKDVRARSGHMSERFRNLDLTRAELDSAIEVIPAMGLSRKGRSAMVRSAYYMIGLMDSLAATAVWLGAESRARAGKVPGLDPTNADAAALYADEITQITQSAGTKADLPRILADPSVLQFVLAFHGIQNTFYNLYLRNVSRAKRGEVYRPVLFLLTHVLVVSYLENQITDLIKQMKGEEDDDEESTKNWMWGMLGMATNPIPGGGDVTAAVRWGPRSVRGGLASAAVEPLVKTGMGVVENIQEDADWGEFVTDFLRDAPFGVSNAIESLEMVFQTEIIND